MWTMIAKSALISTIQLLILASIANSMPIEQLQDSALIAQSQPEAVALITADHELGIYLNVANFVLTDFEYELVLRRLQKEAELLNLTIPEEMSSSNDNFKLDNLADEDALKVKSEGELNRLCPICLDELSLGDDLVLRCDHIYHAACLNEWKATRLNAKCPICGVVMDPKARIRHKSD